MQQDLNRAGLANCMSNIYLYFFYLAHHALLYYLIPQTFMIWWTAWNDCYPVNFPLPATIFHHTSLHTLAPELIPFYHLLFNCFGEESHDGITIRRAWETLDPVARDLMVHCWCSKKENDVIGNAIVHPGNTKQRAQDLFTHDLCDDLQYLQPRAMSYISRAPEIFK
jgi:hypothetical protein